LTQWIGQLDFALAYGHAAATAYSAYNDSVFLNYSIQSWWFGRAYTLVLSSENKVVVGNTSVKNAPVIQVCQDIPMNGGTFYRSDELDDLDVATLGTGNFFVLSALLAEATADSLYLQAAKDSENFIQTHLLNHLFQVQDSINAAANDSCATNSLPESYNAGLTIEGLAILYSKTQDPATWTLLNNIVNATILNPAWQHPSGVLTVGDLYLLRGLTTLYVRGTIPDLMDDIGHYIAVQFNAVTDLATANGSNVYANNWAGPPSSAFFPTNQSNAISALLGAISLRNDSESATSVPGPAPTTTPPSGTAPVRVGKPSKVAAIVGGVCSVVALMTCGFFIWLIRRRRLRSRSESNLTLSVNPFGIWYHMRRRGKNARNALSEEPATTASTSFSRDKLPHRRPAPTVSVPVLSPDIAVPSQRSDRVQPPSNLPTEELVRILNERLQGRDWDAEEVPPEYPV
ncbi:hypothetical protein C8F04DRAFT_177188, partial [Mycena alexandri]